MHKRPWLSGDSPSLLAERAAGAIGQSVVQQTKWDNQGTLCNKGKAERQGSVNLFLGAIQKQTSPVLKCDCLVQVMMQTLRHG